MLIIGLTGGIGSGKTTVSGILSNLGAVVIDFDKIARDVSKKGEEAYAEIVEYFGKEVLDDNSELNRKMLADLVFSDSQKLAKLNDIIHKYVVERTLSDIKTIKKAGKSDLIVIDAPLPIKHGFLDIVDEVWVVAADKDTRIKRVMERSGLTYEQALGRVNAQKTDKEYIDVADEVLYNNGNVEELEKNTVALYKKKKRKTGKRGKFKFLTFFIITLIIVFVILGNTSNILFPIKYRDIIENYAGEYEIDPYLVLAIIKAESNFDSSALSNKNAKGLMQISDATGKWAADSIKLRNYETSKLFEPDININIGCWYLRNLTNEFGDNIDLTLAAYNAGSGNVREWLEDPEHSLSGKALDKIPFPETENYLKKVKNYHIIYKRLYANLFK